MPALDDLLRFLGPGATPALLVFIMALWRRDVVLGWQYDAMARDRDEWKHMALHGLDTTEGVTNTVQQLAQKVGKEV